MSQTLKCVNPQVTTPENVPGATINFATYQSAIHGFAHADELKPLRRQIYPGKVFPFWNQL